MKQPPRSTCASSVVGRAMRRERQGLCTRLCEIAGTAALQIKGAHDLTDAAGFEGATCRGRDRAAHRPPIEDLRDGITDASSAGEAAEVAGAAERSLR